MADGPDLVGLWKRVNEILRKGDINRSLWEAADRAKILVVEEGTLVLGLSPADMRHAGYLTTPTNKRMLEAILKEVTKRDLTIEVIEGNDAEAWESLKAREVHKVDNTAQKIEYRTTHGTALGAWEELNQSLHQYYTENIGIRRFADQMAKTLIKLLPLVADTEDKARAADPDAEQLHQTHLNRAMDRLSTYCEIPATVVALEYFRYRSSRKRQG